MKKIFILLAVLCCARMEQARAAIFVGAGTGGTNICSNRAATGSSPAFNTLSDIVFFEGANADIGNGANVLVINAPAGWSFNTASPPTYTWTAGRNITLVAGGGMTTTSLTVNITTTGTTMMDAFRIIGLQVQANTTGSAAGSIRASVAAVLNGVTTGPGGTNFGNLSLQTALVPGVTIAQSPAGAICAGTSVTFTATPANGGTPTYQWHLNGTPVAGATSVTYPNGSLTNGNTIMVTMSATGCVSTPTVNSAVTTMTVNPIPAVITGVLSVCQAGTTTLSSASAGGAWTSSVLGVATISTPGGIVAGITPGTSNITYTMPTSCRTSTQITVNPLPAAFNVTGGGSYCASGSGVSIGLDGSASGFTYDLSDGTSTVATLPGTGSALNFGLFTAGGTYTASATNTATSCVRSMVGGAVLTVAPPVVPSVSIGASATLVCSGSSVTFTATPVNEGVSPAYQWYVNGIPTVTGTTFSYVPANGDVVTVTLYPGGICAVPDSATVDYTVVVTPLATPGVSISVNPGNPSCLGDPVMFTAIPVSGGTAPAYRWTKNGVNVATGPSYIYTPANGDVVYCMITSSYVCRSIDSAFSANTIMTVQASAPLPVVSISALPGTTISPGETVALTAVATGAAGPLDYQWILNGTAISGATTPVYTTNTYVNGDIVTCRVSNTDPCADFVLKSVLISTGTTGFYETGDRSNSLVIVPNPNKGVFSLTGDLNIADNAYLSIKNMLGQEVFGKQVIALSSRLNETITTDKLPAGMYLLEIRSANTGKKIHFVISE
jgi:hypothetical protein